MYGGQLRLRLVPEASPLSAAIVRYYLFAQEARRRSTDGPGCAEIALQGTRLG